MHKKIAALLGVLVGILLAWRSEACIFCDWDEDQYHDDPTPLEHEIIDPGASLDVCRVFKDEIEELKEDQLIARKYLNQMRIRNMALRQEVTELKGE